MKQTELKVHKSRHCNVKNNSSMPPEMVKIQPTVWENSHCLPLVSCLNLTKGMNVHLSRTGVWTLRITVLKLV